MDDVASNICQALVKGKGVMRTYFVDGIAKDAVSRGKLQSALTRVSIAGFTASPDKALPGMSLKMQSKVKNRWVQAVRKAGWCNFKPVLKPPGFSAHN